MTLARAQRSKAALTGKTEEGESDGESTSSLNGERRAAVKGVRLTRKGDVNMPKPEVALAGMSRSRWKLAVGEVSACLHCSHYLPN